MRVSVVVSVNVPEVPVMVTAACPVEAELPAVSVRMLEPVLLGLGLKFAVAPLGSPEAVKETLPVKPLAGVTVMVSMPLSPWLIVTALAAAESEKLGAAFTVRVSVAVSVNVPEVPVMVTVA